MSLKREMEKKRTTEHNLRKDVITLYLNKKISRKQAAFQLDLSPRQVSRIAVRSHAEGVPLGTLRRKRPSRKATRTYSSLFRAQVLDIVTTYYSDYNPTLATEKLLEYHNIKLSVETLRQWLIQAGLRTAVVKKPSKSHPLRARRASRGELIQIDGSFHDWFEGRGDKCTLLVMVDDATSEIMHLQCAPSESFESYSHFLIGYMLKHGKPRALYSDKHSVFSINAYQDNENLSETHFKRALNSLGIESILAHSPQAKGRVERLNKTLQDRLVKYFREHNVSSIAQGNALLQSFQEDYNRKKKKPPENPLDLHTPLSEEERASLGFIFRKTATRLVSESGLIRFENKLYRITPHSPGLKGQEITLSCCLDGAVVLSLSSGAFVEYEVVRSSRPTVASGKELEVMRYSIPSKDSGIHLAAYQLFTKARYQRLLDTEDIAIPPPSPNSTHLRPFSF